MSPTIKVLARPIRDMGRRINELRHLRAEYKKLVADRDRLRERLSRINPGHFYSPIPDLEDVRRRADRIFDRQFRELPGIDLQIAAQLELLRGLKQFYAEQPFGDEPDSRRRYYFRNGFFSYGDGLCLYGMIRHARPRRIIEIGSGFSSFVMLDTNDLFFEGQIRLTFIEPYDERLRSRLRNRDHESVDILVKPVQEVDPATFRDLAAGDILFIDSSHVSKVGSDVNHILFEILPAVPKGVLIHFHDVFYPFEYPRDWVEEGRCWTEDYLLRAFLQFNSAFKIRLWCSMLAMFHPEKVSDALPLAMKNPGGSLWLERV